MTAAIARSSSSTGAGAAALARQRTGYRADCPGANGRLLEYRQQRRPTNRHYDPTTTRPDPARPGQFIRDAFPDNRIPENRIDPIARKILDFYPLPNRGHASSELCSKQQP
jgi:hypothetical protein